MTDIILSASILSAADFSRLGDEIRAAEQGGVDWIHVDVMDGMFVPNITMGPFIVDTLRRITSLPLDVHLMIEKPENHIKAFRDAGASILTVQKISQVRDMLNQEKSNAIIQVDGGITADTLSLVVEAGARSIVAATAIFKHPNGISAGIQALRNAAV